MAWILTSFRNSIVLLTVIAPPPCPELNSIQPASSKHGLNVNFSLLLFSPPRAIRANAEWMQRNVGLIICFPNPRNFLPLQRYFNFTLTSWQTTPLDCFTVLQQIMTTSNSPLSIVAAQLDVAWSESPKSSHGFAYDAEVAHPIQR